MTTTQDLYDRTLRLIAEHNRMVLFKATCTDGFDTLYTFTKSYNLSEIREDLIFFLHEEHDFPWKMVWNIDTFEVIDDEGYFSDEEPDR
jgi:hypothetical protein